MGHLFTVGFALAYQKNWRALLSLWGPHQLGKGKPALFQDGPGFWQLLGWPGLVKGSHRQHLSVYSRHNTYLFFSFLFRYHSCPNGLLLSFGNVSGTLGWALEPHSVLPVCNCLVYASWLLWPIWVGLLSELASRVVMSLYAVSVSAKLQWNPSEKIPSFEEGRIGTRVRKHVPWFI